MLEMNKKTSVQKMNNRWDAKQTGVVGFVVWGRLCSTEINVAGVIYLIEMREVRE